MPKGCYRIPVPLPPPSISSLERKNKPASFRGHFPLDLLSPLLFYTLAPIGPISERSTLNRAQCPSQDPQDLSMGGLSPPCLRGVILALTDQNNIITSCYVAAWYFFHAPLSPPGPSLWYCCCGFNFSGERGVCAALAAAISMTWGSNFCQLSKRLFWGDPPHRPQGAMEGSLQS